MNREMKQINIKPKDFSDRKYYPGTDEHPFTFINQIQGIVEKIPAPLYAIIFSGLIYLISRETSNGAS